MLKKIILILGALSIATVSCSSTLYDNEKQVHGDYPQKVKALVEKAEKEKTENPETKDSNKPAIEFNQFPREVQFLGELINVLNHTSIDQGAYRGGVFLTYYKNNKKPVLVHIFPQCLKEIQTVLNKTTIDLTEGDIRNIKFNPNSKNSCQNGLLGTSDTYEGVLDNEKNHLHIKSIHQLLDIFNSTTIFDTTIQCDTDGTIFDKIRKSEKISNTIKRLFSEFSEIKRVFPVFYRAFKGHHAIKELRCYYEYHEKYSINGRFRFADSRNDRYREVTYTIINKRIETCEFDNAALWLTRCMWYQLEYLLKMHPVYSKHDHFKNYRRIQMAKKVGAISLGATALAAATYATLWYTGRGQQLPGMNTVFAPTFTYIATKAFNPLCAKVATVFGKKVINTGADLAKTTLHTMATAAELIK